MKLTAEEKELCHEVFTNLNDTDISKLKKLNKEHLIKIIIEGNLAYKVEKDAAEHFFNEAQKKTGMCEAFQSQATNARKDVRYLRKVLTAQRDELRKNTSRMIYLQADVATLTEDQNTMGESNEAVRH